jgi:hypothetical protein
MSDNPRSRACAVCGRVLDSVSDAFGREVGWQHTFADLPADHQPVPVLPSEVHVRGRCDFCQDDDPGWEVPARDFIVPDQPKTASSGAWAACDVCAALVRENEWDRLIARVDRSWRDRHPEMPDAGLKVIPAVYRELRKNITGPVQPLKGW